MNGYKCLICGSSSYNKKLPYYGESPGFLNKSIIRCSGCHTLCVYPLPADEELSSYYNSYWNRQNINNMLPLFKAQAEARYDFLKSYISSGNTLSVIDVGAGFGFIKEVLSKNSPGRLMIYDAVEIDPIAVDYLEKIIKPRNIYSSIEGSKDQYYFMILSHIIEHLKDPLNFLKDQQSRIVNNGILFIEVPNQDYIYKSRNEPHLIFFNQDTLIKLVELAGYKVLRVGTCGKRLEDLKNQSQCFKKIKNILKSYLPKSLIGIIRGLRSDKPSNSLIRYVFDYGPDRQWIRLVALKKIK